jgi:hypothetical protein
MPCSNRNRWVWRVNLAYEEILEGTGYLACTSRRARARFTYLMGVHLIPQMAQGMRIR